MTYGITVTQKEVEILEDNQIDYTFWDFAELLFGGSEKVEIEFETKDEMEKALRLLGGRLNV